MAVYLDYCFSVLDYRHVTLTIQISSDWLIMAPIEPIRSYGLSLCVNFTNEYERLVSHRLVHPYGISSPTSEVNSTYLTLSCAKIPIWLSFLTLYIEPFTYAYRWIDGNDLLNIYRSLPKSIPSLSKNLMLKLFFLFLVIRSCWRMRDDEKMNAKEVGKVFSVSEGKKFDIRMRWKGKEFEGWGVA